MATTMSAIANSMKGEEAKIAPGVSAKSPQPSAPVPKAAPGRLPVMKKIDPDALVPGEDRPVNPNEKPKPFLKDWQCPKPMTIRAWKLKPARYVVESARELLRVDGEYLDNCEHESRHPSPLENLCASPLTLSRFAVAFSHLIFFFFRGRQMRICSSSGSTSRASVR